MRKVQINKIYRRFKENYYITIDIATHSETNENFKGHEFETFENEADKNIFLSLFSDCHS